MVYVGIDLHKKNAQIAAADERGKILMNRKIPHTREAIRYETLHLPKHAKYVIESSSVWEGTYCYMTEELGLNVIVSNPYMTLLIAKSKKKTDKVDAAVLADMLRGDFISQCYVPDRETSSARKVVRHRHSLVEKRTSHKNSIHGILLQMSFKLRAAVPFTPVWLARVRRIGDYRIDDHLMQISSLNESIIKSDVKIADMAKDNPDAMLLKTIPGVGYFSALVISSMIGDIERFNRSDDLCSYAGLVPSVRSSAGTVHHGRITHRGDALMRWVLTECVLSHVRYAKNSYIAEFYTRIKKKRGSGKAIVAAASKMLRIMYGMLKEGKEYVPYRS